MIVKKEMQQFFDYNFHTTTLHFNYHPLGYSSLRSVDRIVLGRRKQGQRFSDFQKRVLLKSFLNNGNLTEDTRKKLCNRLGLTRQSVASFFRYQNKKPRTQIIEMYSKLLPGEKLKYLVICFTLHLFSLQSFH